MIFIFNYFDIGIELDVFKTLGPGAHFCITDAQTFGTFKNKNI